MDDRRMSEANEEGILHHILIAQKSEALLRLNAKHWSCDEVTPQCEALCSFAKQKDTLFAVIFLKMTTKRHLKRSLGGSEPFLKGSESAEGRPTTPFQRDDSEIRGNILQTTAEGSCFRAPKKVI